MRVILLGFGGVLSQRPTEVFRDRSVCDTVERLSDVSLSNQQCKPRVDTSLKGDDSILFRW